MKFTEDKILEISKLKKEDYLQNMLIDILLKTTDYPMDEAIRLRDEALIKCTYDDPTIDKQDYAKLQKAIEHEIRKFFDVLIEKLKQKTEYF